MKAVNKLGKSEQSAMVVQKSTFKKRWKPERQSMIVAITIPKAALYHTLVYAKFGGFLGKSACIDLHDFLDYYQRNESGSSEVQGTQNRTKGGSMRASFP